MHYTDKVGLIFIFNFFPFIYCDGSFDCRTIDGKTYCVYDEYEKSKDAQCEKSEKTLPIFKNYDEYKRVFDELLVPNVASNKYFTFPITYSGGKWIWMDCTELDSSFTNTFTNSLPSSPGDKCARIKMSDPDHWYTADCNNAESYPLCVNVDEGACTYRYYAAGKELCLINKKFTDYATTNSRCNNLQYSLLEEDSSFRAHILNLCIMKGKTDEDVWEKNIAKDKFYVNIKRYSGVYKYVTSQISIGSGSGWDPDGNKECVLHKLEDKVEDKDCTEDSVAFCARDYTPTTEPTTAPTTIETTQTTTIPTTTPTTMPTTRPTTSPTTIETTETTTMPTTRPTTSPTTIETTQTTIIPTTTPTTSPTIIETTQTTTIPTTSSTAEQTSQPVTAPSSTPISTKSATIRTTTSTTAQKFTTTSASPTITEEVTREQTTTTSKTINISTSKAATTKTTENFSTKSTEEPTTVADDTTQSKSDTTITDDLKLETTTVQFNSSKSTNVTSILSSTSTKQESSILNIRTTITPEEITETVVKPSDKIECPSLEIEGKHVAIENNDRSYGTVVTYQCLPGYSFKDKTTFRSTECIGKGTWSTKVEICQAVQCTSNNNFRSHIGSYDKIETIHCDGDKKMHSGRSKAEARCTPNGKWNTHLECVDNPCGPIPFTPKLLVRIKKMSGYGSEIIYKCPEGQIFNDGTYKQISKCNIDGWSVISSICIPDVCKAIPEIINGTRSGNNTKIGSIVNYTCFDGLRFEDGLTTRKIFCTNSTLWSRDVTDCKVRCVAAPVFNNTVPDKTLTDIGTTINYSCRKGYIFTEDSNSIKSTNCNESLSWTPLNIACEIIVCPKLHIKYATISTNLATYGTTVQVNCMEGYVMLKKFQSLNITCIETRNWDIQNLTCNTVKCLEPPTVNNSVIEDRKPIYYYNEKVHIKCITGFEFSDIGKDEVNATCSAVATWIGFKTNCSKIQCPILPLWESAEISSNKRSFETVVNITCTHDDSIYQLLKCGENKKWTPDYRNCPDARKEEVKPAEAEQAVEIGSLAIGIMINDNKLHHPYSYISIYNEYE
ncbi:DgyrCDS4161 [Dimorphilus gyrociliatus]|uniref:DgyrCDS4161 n=1 Tax=Dimorphilus gyrociliatus TaxID=2664684 RepID=A0A7I8VFL8_9ANNE|nr:DgyrCDS4161 [Dimorphilus gyrociliatus]